MTQTGVEAQKKVTEREPTGLPAQQEPLEPKEQREDSIRQIERAE